MDNKRALISSTRVFQANAATRHQLFQCIPLTDLSIGNGENQHLGSTITILAMKVRCYVISSVYIEETRIEVPNVRPTTGYVFFENNNYLKSTSFVDADITGYKATIEGIAIPVDGQLMTQINTAIPGDRFTVTQNIVTESKSNNLNNALLQIQTEDQSPNNPTYFRSLAIKMDTPVRFSLIRTDFRPLVNATTADEFFSMYPTYTPYDPTFTPYNAYPITQYYKSPKNESLQIYADEYMSVQTGTQYHCLFEYNLIPSVSRNDQRYKNVFYNPSQGGDQSQATQGGFYLNVLSDVVYSFSNSPGNNLLIEPIRANTRWVIHTDVELTFIE